MNGFVNPERPRLLEAVFGCDSWALRAATTLRTITESYGKRNNQKIGNSEPMLRQLEKRTSKSLFDVDHLPRTRLHEAAIPRSRIFQAPLARHHPFDIQIALVACNELHGLYGPGILPVLALHVDHGEEVVKGVERRCGGYVVNEEEGIRSEVGGGPETTVLFLAGRVGKGEVVRMAVDDAGDGVGVLCLSLWLVHGRFLRVFSGGRRQALFHTYSRIISTIR